MNCPLSRWQMTICAELRTIYSHHWMMKKMATTTPRRGEVWLVDLGMVAKIRPCLVVSIPANDENQHAGIQVRNCDRIAIP
ncbi:MAG: hypothetical protein ACKOAH_32835, partial [Pirellula sp.]